MKKFFEPETVALIGATGKPMRPGYHLFLNLETCFGEKFFAVNPRGGKIGNKTVYPDILSVPGDIDVAIIFIPAVGVPEALEQCAKKGIKHVIIESAGFAEVGEEGKKLQDRCVEIARGAGMRLWGPNCMGVINVHQTKVLSFMLPFIWQGRFVPGGVSLVVQSGMLSAGFLMHILSRTPFGLSKVCSIGNKADVDEVDILEYLIEDPQTTVIAMYLESILRGRQFCELAKKSHKPLVVLKSGRSQFGSLAAASHTASLAQNDKVLEGAFRQARIIRVNGMKEMMDVARCLSVSVSPSSGRARVAIITFSGGAGVVSADFLADYGMELAQLKPNTLARIKKVFPEWMDPANPVDLYPAMEKFGPTDTVRESISALMEDDGVDAIYAHLFAPPVGVPLFDYDKMAKLVKEHRKPLVVWIMGHAESASAITKELESRGIPVVEEIGRGVRVLCALTLQK